MAAPAWLKPGLVGAGAGAVALTIAGFSWGGWVTGGTAEAMASDRARLEVVGALVPFCVALSQADPQQTRITAELAEAASYKRAGYPHEGRVGDHAGSGRGRPGSGQGLRRDARRRIVTGPRTARLCGRAWP